MKKILSVIVSLVMSVGLLSVSVRAEGNPKISISGSLWIYDETASGEGWNFSRNGTEGTLELTKTDITGEIGIYATDMNLTIILTGANKVTGTAAAGINVSGNLTITGDGSLNVSGASGYGIKCKGTLTFSGNITVTAISPSYAMEADGGFSIGEGLGIISPEGARLNDYGTWIVNKDDDKVIEATIGPNTVTITFDANGGTPATTTQTIAKGGKATAPDPDPIYEVNNIPYYNGTTFYRWYETADHSGDPVDFSTKTFDSDTTLYASWEVPIEIEAGIWSEHSFSSVGCKTILVNEWTFPEGVGAVVFDGPPEDLLGESITFDFVPYEGYGLVGFAHSPDGELLSTEAPYTIVSDGTWYKMWIMYGPLKTITFVDEDGTVLQETEVAAGRTPEYTGDTPTKKEDKNYTYTFDKWDPEITEVTEDATYTATYTRKKKSSSSSSSSSATTTTTTTDSTWTDTSSTTSSTTTYTPPVTPSYRPQPTTTAYTVWFETDGGTEIAAQTVNAGTTAAKPYDPEKEGYLFDGWYSDKELTEEFDFLTPINANTTVYAKWTEPEEEPAEIIPKPTEEPEPTEPEPAEPEKKSSKPWMWPLLALILGALGVGGWKLTRQR